MLDTLVGSIMSNQTQTDYEISLMKYVPTLII
jgi:hypothetical protein